MFQWNAEAVRAMEHEEGTRLKKGFMCIVLG